jgi:leucyl-tRNA synthetase
MSVLEAGKHEELQRKWSTRWDLEGCHRASDVPTRPKFYNRDAAPYPNGGLHIGHLRNYVLGDIIARYKRQCGFDVLYATNFDAFGLPNELAALKQGVSPDHLTQENIKTMSAMFYALGVSYDWSRVKSTSHPGYYRWTQWLFLRLHKAGLVYRAEKQLPWCPSCQVTLAFIQITDGDCWRCGTAVETRSVPQWFIRLSAATEKLDRSIDSLAGWAERPKHLMRGFIGRSEGMEWSLPLANEGLSSYAIKVFAPADIHIRSAAFVAIAPATKELVTLIELADGRFGVIPPGNFRERAAALNDIASMKGLRRSRTGDETIRQGFDTGLRLATPLCPSGIPVWAVNYLSVDAGPAARACAPDSDMGDRIFALNNSIEPAHQAPSQPDAHQPVITQEPKVCYQVRDWAISRGRQWGTPIPFIHCSQCGPVPVDEASLPLTHEDRIETSSSGSVPRNVPCPKCGGAAQYDPETLDCNFDDSWCFVTGPYQNSETNPFLDSCTRSWLPVDWYHSGYDVYTITHVHRFISHFLFEQGLTPCQDLIKGYQGHDLVLGAHGKISKRYGNEGDLARLIEDHGSDVLRLAIAWAASPGKQIHWNYSLLAPARKLLRRLVTLADQITKPADSRIGKPAIAPRHMRQMESSLAIDIERVAAFISAYRPNAALRIIDRRISILSRQMHKCLVDGTMHPDDQSTIKRAVQPVVQILSPFAPFHCEEIWEMLGGTSLVATTPWPQTHIADMK